MEKLQSPIASEILPFLPRYLRDLSREKYFGKAYNNKKVPSVHALIVFSIFSFLVGLALWNYLLIFKILPVTRVKDPKAAIDTEQAYRNPPVIL